jgi:superfamily II DNA or RNA helicase
MKSKTERQLEIVDKWIDNNYIGTLVAVTGFGKTRTVIEAILKLDRPETIIVVPTLILKEQWLKVLANYQISAKVLVINTASKLSLDTDLLVLDEIHTCAAETFKEVFNQITYKKIFGLTATIERADGKHDLLVEKCPIIDVVPFSECIANKWISGYVIYNLAVPLLPSDQILYNKVDSSFRYFASMLGYNDAFDTAKQWLASGTSEQKGKAMAYLASIRKRKSIIVNNKNKALAAKAIITRFIEPTIIFSESISFANELTKSLSDVLVSIHSKMTAKEQKLAMLDFNNPLSKKRGIVSVKALTAGVDIAELSLGIIASFNSSKLADTQTVGRLIRSFGNKQAKIVNLYTPNTQEVSWLKNKQKGSNPKFINLISEII